MTTDQLKAIETRYDGRLFRSRREARWAVFFKEAGIDAEYEEQGYDLGEAGWYLPDFHVNKGTHAEHFFEVKGVTPTSEELAKAAALGEQSKLPVYVYYAEPRLPAPAALTDMTEQAWLDWMEQNFDRDMARSWLASTSCPSWSVRVDLHRTWSDDYGPTAFRALRTRKGKGITRAAEWWYMDCPHCGLVVPKLYGQVGLCPSLPDDHDPAYPLYPQFRHATKRLQDAYSAARSERFERVRRG